MANLIGLFMTFPMAAQALLLLAITTTQAVFREIPLQLRKVCREARVSVVLTQVQQEWLLGRYAPE